MAPILGKSNPKKRKINVHLASIDFNVFIFKMMSLNKNSLEDIAKPLNESLRGRFTNQSMRGTAASLLFQNGFEECRFSGHKSTAVRI